MKKPYFAKYLPVEGEIQEGGKYVYITNKVRVTKKSFPIPPNPDVKPVKLFLCSRDIQVGDKAYTGDPSMADLDTVYERAEDIPVGESGLLTSSSFIKEKIAYKVIGEISPKATWVKGGDEFEGEGIDFVIAVSDEEYDFPEILQKPFYMIKGPCGHFH